MSKLTLYYDEVCPRCSSWAKKLQRIGGKKIQLLPLQEEGLQQSDVDPQRAVQAIPARTDKGRVLYGFDALQAVIARIWWLWLLWPLTFLMQKSGLGACLYRYFSSRRYTNCSSQCLREPKSPP